MADEKMSRDLFVIRIVKLEGIVENPPAENPAGQYVKSFEWKEGDRGSLTTTAELKHAKLFLSAEEATNFYRQDRGRRPDGAPNRPLTAFTVEILPVQMVWKGADA